MFYSEHVYLWHLQNRSSSVLSEKERDRDKNKVSHTGMEDWRIHKHLLCKPRSSVVEGQNEGGLHMCVVFLPQSPARCSQTPPVLQSFFSLWMSNYTRTHTCTHTHTQEAVTMVIERPKETTLNWKHMGTHPFFSSSNHTHHSCFSYIIYT